MRLPRGLYFVFISVCAKASVDLYFFYNAHHSAVRWFAGRTDGWRQCKHRRVFIESATSDHRLNRISKIQDFLSSVTMLEIICRCCWMSCICLILRQIDSTVHVFRDCNFLDIAQIDVKIWFRHKIFVCTRIWCIDAYLLFLHIYFHFIFFSLLRRMFDFFSHVIQISIFPENYLLLLIDSLQISWTMKWTLCLAESNLSPTWDGFDAGIIVCWFQMSSNPVQTSLIICYFWYKFCWFNLYLFTCKECCDVIFADCWNHALS